MEGAYPIPQYCGLAAFPTNTYILAMGSMNALVVSSTMQLCIACLSHCCAALTCAAHAAAKDTLEKTAYLLNV
jgi:hypothetical protein